MMYTQYAHTYIILFFFNDTATTEIYSLSLHDALPILECTAHPEYKSAIVAADEDDIVLTERVTGVPLAVIRTRSEEHTSELQSQSNLVCRLLLEKKKITVYTL